MSRRRSRTAVASAALLALLPLAGASAQPAASYGAPFALGPAGGDTYSRYSADPAGTVTIGRVMPVPALVGCGAGAPYANLRVTHVTSGPLSEVVVQYDTAAVEPYTFLSVGIHGGGEWFASSKTRGVLTGSGTVTVPISWPEEADLFPRTLNLDIGLEASGACPSVNGGTVRFTKVTVS